MSASKKYCSLSYIDSIRIRTLRRAPGDLAGRLQARHAGHGDVEDGEVDVRPRRRLDGLGPVARLGDDRQVGLAVEDQAQAAADERVVVGQQDAGGHDGTSSRTSVPPPDRPSICSAAAMVPTAVEVVRWSSS